jgi:transposase
VTFNVWTGVAGFAVVTEASARGPRYLAKSPVTVTLFEEASRARGTRDIRHRREAARAPCTNEFEPPTARIRGAHTGPSPVDRARPGSKHHLIVDRHGTPLAVSLTSGNRHDVTQLMPLLDAIPHIRGLRGRPRHRPRRLFADRGYDYDKYRRLVRARGITPKIARRGVPHGSGLGKTRWVVERTFAWLHQFKRLRTRYEIRAGLHRALLQLACGILCLRRLRTSF